MRTCDTPMQEIYFESILELVLGLPRTDVDKYMSIAEICRNGVAQRIEVQLPIF